MTSGGEVVEDYRHVGLTLRQHPASFLRAELASRRIVTCTEAMSARDGKWLTTAGLVLVRQKPGSAKGVMFITIEDETGVANLVIWPSLYERQRRIILAAGMIGVQGRVQREGEVVHLVANQLTDLSAELAGVGEPRRRLPAAARARRRIPSRQSGHRSAQPAAERPKPRDIYVPDLHIDSIKVKTRELQVIRRASLVFSIDRSKDRAAEWKSYGEPIQSFYSLRRPLARAMSYSAAASAVRSSFHFAYRRHDIIRRGLLDHVAVPGDPMKAALGDVRM